MAKINMQNIDLICVNTNPLANLFEKSKFLLKKKVLK